MRIKLLVLLVGLICFEASANLKIVQFSGIIKDGVENVPIPFASIYVKSNFRGTITNLEGFFSFPVREGDTIVVRSLGHKNFEVVIPTNLEKKSFSRMILLERDTFQLDEVEIYPWPSKQQFREAFINLEVPDNLMETAKRNFEKMNLQDFDKITPYDSRENYDLYVKSYVNKMYYSGQSAPIQLLNPFAWAEFFRAAKRGDFKRE